MPTCRVPLPGEPQGQRPEARLQGGSWRGIRLACASGTLRAVPARRRRYLRGSAGRRGARRARADPRGRRHRPPRLAWPVGAGPGAGGGGEGWDGALARGFSPPHPLLPSPPVPVRLQVPPQQLGGRRGMLLPPPCPAPE